jgi:hypothetical protein
VLGGRRRRVGVHLGRHRRELQLACGRGCSLVLVLVLVCGVEGGLAPKGQADGGGTNDSGSCTELCHGSASVMGTWCYGEERARERKWDGTGHAAAGPGSRATEAPGSQNKRMQGQGEAARAGPQASTRTQEGRRSYRWNRFHSRSLTVPPDKLALRQGTRDSARSIMASRRAHGSGAARGETDRTTGAISSSGLRSRAASRRGAGRRGKGQPTQAVQESGGFEDERRERVQKKCGCYWDAHPSQGSLPLGGLARPPVNWSSSECQNINHYQTCRPDGQTASMERHGTTCSHPPTRHLLSLPTHGHAAVPRRGPRPLASPCVYCTRSSSHAATSPPAAVLAGS